MAYPTAMPELIGLWMGWLFMLMIYSYPLYKENPVYRFAEHTFIGMMISISIMMNLQYLVNTAITPLFQGTFTLIIPLIIGALMYTLLSPKYRWMSRYPIALLVGAGFGLGMRGTIKPNILDATINTITAPVDGGTMTWINFLFIAVGLICSVMYFLLTYEHTGLLKHPTRIGRLFIMVALGAYFGNTVLFRFTMLTGRAKFFLQVLKIIPM